MAVTEQKLPRLRRAVGAAGLRLRVDGRRLAHHHVAGAAAAAAARPEDIERFLACDARLSALEEATCRSAAARCASSSAISCFRTTPTHSSSRLARDSASLALVQLTLREEAEPEVEGGRRLVDVEGSGELDLVIDEPAVRDYRARFSRLRLGLSRAARRVGARFAHVVGRHAAS